MRTMSREVGSLWRFLNGEFMIVAWGVLLLLALPSLDICEGSPTRFRCRTYQITQITNLLADLIDVYHGLSTGHLRRIALPRS